MSYITQWRKRKAEVEALAVQSTSSSSNEYSEEILLNQSISSNSSTAGLIDYHSDAVPVTSEEEFDNMLIDEESGEDSPPDLKEDLAYFATKNRMTRAAMTDLLAILRLKAIVCLKILAVFSTHRRKYSPMTNVVVNMFILL